MEPSLDEFIEISTESLLAELTPLDNSASAALLERVRPETAASALRALPPQTAGEIVALLASETRERLLALIPLEIRTQWTLNETFPDGSIGRMMDPPHAVFAPQTTVKETVDILRDLVKREFITYGYVVDATKKLIGVVVMRDLLFADPQAKLDAIMIRDPFSLKAASPLMDAMKEVLTRHFPIYPVTNESGELIGLIRGHRLFEAQAVEISAQAGSMVGVEKEERLSTPWSKSLRYRHPWLQLNLLTAFVAGAVVSIFQDTIDRLVILAAFLPVLAGQSGNTGCQALAVTLRGMTLQKLKDDEVRRLLRKESLLGVLNGTMVGVSASIGMYLLARSQGNPLALPLSGIVFCAMIGSCFVSGLFGALVPLTLKRLGADPATASSIFLTTATDVASMGILLSLATWLLL